jgi:archaellum biogenesis protein FlaJ (TadC family)
MRLSLKDGLHESLHEGKKHRWKPGAYSKAYHRFFEGYSEIAVPTRDERGIRIERIYTGNYYRQDLTNRQHLLIRVLYIALFLCALGLYISSAIQPLLMNNTWYVVLFEAASLFFLSWTFVVFISYIPAKKDMTINDYRSSSLTLKKATLLGAICLGVTALATLIFIIMNPQEEFTKTILCMAEYLLSGLLILGMNQIERRVNYLIISNPQKPTDDSFEIN